MSKTKTIPAGYRLTVETWENDGDNYRTEVIYGLDKETLVYMVDLCKLFFDGSEICNMYEPSDSERHSLETELEKLCKLHNRKAFDECEADAWNSLYDLGITKGEFYTRVVSNIVVEYFPNNIYISDVTEEFI